MPCGNKLSENHQNRKESVCYESTEIKKKQKHVEICCLILIPEIISYSILFYFVCGGATLSNGTIPKWKGYVHFLTLSVTGGGV